MNLKQRKGITLVALVITIVILLILAGISISALTNQGLFEKTQVAKEKHENAQIEEDETLKNYENEIDEYVSSARETVTIDKEEYEYLLENCIRYPDFTNCLGSINTVGGSWVAIENCLMVATIEMGSTGGNTPTVFIDGVAVLTYANWSSNKARSTMTMYVQKGQTITTRSDDIRGTTYDIKFYKLK